MSDERGGVMPLYGKWVCLCPYMGTPQRHGFLGWLKLITPYYSRLLKKKIIKHKYLCLFSTEFKKFDCLNYHPPFVFFIFKSAGEGEGWFEGDSTWLIHYKKKHKKHRQPPSCIVKFLQILCSSCIRLILVIL